MCSDQIRQSGASSASPVVFFRAPDEAHPAAERLFERVQSELRHLFARAGLRHVLIEHIGATSVPGLTTKGDLDVNVRVAGEDFSLADGVLARRYARNTGCDRTPTYSAFEDPSAMLPLGIQLTVINSADDFFCTLRDRLRSSPALVAELSELKRRFHGAAHDEYRAAKSAWIERTLLGSAEPLTPSRTPPAPHPPSARSSSPTSAGPP